MTAACPAALQALSGSSPLPGELPPNGLRQPCDPADQSTRRDKPRNWRPMRSAGKSRRTNRSKNSISKKPIICYGAVAVIVRPRGLTVCWPMREEVGRYDLDKLQLADGPALVIARMVQVCKVVNEIIRYV